MKYMFLVIFMTVFALINIYTYKRFIKKLFISNQINGFEKYFLLFFKFFKYLLFAFFVAVALFMLARYYDFFSQNVLFIFSYIIGISFMLFIVALIYDLIYSIAKRVPYKEERRKFIKIGFDITALSFALLYIAKGISNGKSEPILNEVEIKIQNLKEDFRVIQLSDVHIGNTIKREFLEKIVDKIAKLNVDLVVITGDLVDLRVDKIRDDLEPLKNLKSKYGTYFILGNHEYFHQPFEIIEYIKSLNINILLNESKVIANSFNLVGITDRIGKRIGILEPDIKKAFSKIDENLPSILLSHQPKMIEKLNEFTPELVLSGHTHGGQIFPFGALVLLDQPYLKGLHNYSTSKQIYISSGTGFWGPAIRILAPSEITLIKLKK